MAILLSAGFATDANAQNDPLPVDKATKKAVVDSIADKYTKWSKLSISGKLSSSLLPVSASVKIYMDKGKLTLISISAPLVGEAARIEIDSDAAVVVNKLNKTYARISMDDIRTLCPGGQPELQSLILGRVALLGRGELSSSDASCLEIYDTYPSSWVLIPDSDFQQDGAVYFYTVQRGTLDLLQFVLMSEDETADMAVQYSRDSKGNLTMEMEAILGARSFAGTLKLNAPERATKAMDRIKIDSKYREVSLKQVIRM